MAETPKVYVLCDQNCKYEGMTKEQIYTAIIEALETGTVSNVDTGFVQTIKTINNIPLKFFVGSQASYDALSDEDKENLFAIISDDTSKADLTALLEDLKTNIEGLETMHNDLCKAVLAEVTYKPALNLPLNCGSSTDTVTTNTFTFKLPDGKTLDNLAFMVVNRCSGECLGAYTMFGTPRSVNDEIRCEVFGNEYAEATRWHASFKFVADGKNVNAYVRNVYENSVQKQKDLSFLRANQGSGYGSDYIKLYFL